MVNPFPSITNHYEVSFTACQYLFSPNKVHQTKLNQIVKFSQDNFFFMNIIEHMATSNQLVKHIKSAKRKLRLAESDLRKPRGPILLGPMDIETPWSEDSRRVQAEKETIEKLTLELGRQVLRERG